MGCIVSVTCQYLMILVRPNEQAWHEVVFTTMVNSHPPWPITAQFPG